MNLSAPEDTGEEITSVAQIDTLSGLKVIIDDFIDPDSSLAIEWHTGDEANNSEDSESPQETVVNLTEENETPVLVWTQTGLSTETQLAQATEASENTTRDDTELQQTETPEELAPIPVEIGEYTLAVSDITLDQDKLRADYQELQHDEDADAPVEEPVDENTEFSIPSDCEHTYRFAVTDPIPGEGPAAHVTGEDPARNSTAMYISLITLGLGLVLLAIGLWVRQRRRIHFG